MKKLLIAAAVGSLIVFMWQFLSWSLLGIHTSQIAYSDKQEAVMAAFADIGLEEGTYFMPTVPPGGDEAALRETMGGKPWARVSYFKSFDTAMGMNMFRGWLISFVSVFLLAWILSGMTNVNLQVAIMISLSVGLIGWMTISYQESIWFETNSLPHLLDALVQWGITGAWLGFFLSRENNS